MQKPALFRFAQLAFKTENSGVSQPIGPGEPVTRYPAILGVYCVQADTPYSPFQWHSQPLRKTLLNSTAGFPA